MKASDDCLIRRFKQEPPGVIQRYMDLAANAASLDRGDDAMLRAAAKLWRDLEAI
jgi:hypothetical protein